MIIQRIEHPPYRYIQTVNGKVTEYHDTYSAKQNHFISTGKTASEAINNLIKEYGYTK